MKRITKYTLAFLIFNFAFLISYSQVAINENNSNPDASAMLDISSTDKGILIPRMGSIARENISNPAKGLMVFDSTTNSFWYYGEAWTEINSDNLSKLEDSDGDTKIQVEKNNDEDFIRFDVASNEAMVINNDGNVGIGSVDPLARLEIETNTNSDGILITRNSVNDAGGIYYSYSTNTGYEAGLQADRDMGGSNNGGLQLLAANSRPIQFYVKGSQSGSGIYDTEEVMRVQGNGNVGIGKDDPQSLLDVDGTVTATSFTGDGSGLTNVGSDDQTIDVFSLSGDNLQLSLEDDGENIKTVNLSGFKQSLSLSNDNLSISNGNSIPLNSAFLSDGTKTYATDTNDDFLFGTNSLNHNSGSERKFFFDKSKGAFRAGAVEGAAWDDSNIGNFSFAAGLNTIASGSYSIAVGQSNEASGNFSTTFGADNDVTGLVSTGLGISNEASGDYAVAIGSTNTASATDAVAIGIFNISSATNAIAIGQDLRAQSFNEIVLGLNNTTYTPDNTSGFDADDRLFVLGNGSNKNNRSNALVINKAGRSRFDGDAFGSNEYVMTIDNTQNNNSSPNNGLLIRAGHDSYTNNNQSSFIRFFRPDGTNCGRIRQDGGNDIQLVDSSDERLKENIKPTRFGIQDVMGIEVKDYNFKTDDDAMVKTGFIAQQLYTVYPEIVTVGDDVKTNPWGVDYAGITPLLVKGIQDQHQIIKKLENEVDQLKNQLSRMDQLEQQNNEMKAMLENIQAELQN